jgi:hypothetical protein
MKKVFIHVNHNNNEKLCLELWEFLIIPGLQEFLPPIESDPTVGRYNFLSSKICHIVHVTCPNLI